MCIAILKPIGKEVTDDQIRNSFASNNQGAGYCFVGKKGKMWIRKGYFEVEKFIEDYRLDEKKFGEDSPALLHFRIATGSAVDEANCHPFAFNHGALIHNGWFFPSTKEKSDTRILTERIGDWLTKERALKHKDELSKYFASNKVVVLYRDKSYVIFNENSGTWQDGVWFSNTSFRNGVVSYRPGPSCAVGTATNRGRVTLPDKYDDKETFVDTEDDWEMYGWPNRGDYRGGYRPPVSDK